MRPSWTPIISLLLPVLLLGAAAAVMLPAPVDAGSRLLQQLLSLTIQVLAAASAAASLQQAARSYDAGDRERRVWQALAVASICWAAGQALYGILEWSGIGQPFPSAADLFFVLAALVMAVGIGVEFRLTLPILTGRQQAVLLGGGVALGVAVAARLLWPIAVAALDPVEKFLDLFYPAMGVALLVLGAGPALAFRGGAAGQVWVGIAAGVGCLALASLGITYLTWFELYSDVHPMNLLRVAGFACFGLSAAWQRRTFELA